MNTIRQSILEARSPSNRVSDSYSTIPSGLVAEALIRKGCTLMKVREPKKGLGKHLMQFVLPGQDISKGQDLLTLNIINSLDGTSSLKAYLGFFVLVCENGLMLGNNFATFDRILHRGFTDDKVTAMIQSAIDQAPKILEFKARASETMPTQNQIAKFVFEAARLRVDDDITLNYNELLFARHREQSANTAWNVFNRVQESLIKGGINATKVVDGQPQTRLTREIKASAELVRINTGLSDLASEILLAA